MIRDLSPSAVDDPSNFVSDNELEILGCEVITNEQSVFDLDSTNKLRII